MNTLNEISTTPFLGGENPAQERYREASELFALFDYLKQQRFGVFSLRESLQAVGENRDGTLQGFHLSAEEAWQSICHMDALGVGVVELPAYPANEPGQAANRSLIERARAAGLAIEFAAHARCAALDIRTAHEAGFQRIHMYIGTSPIKQATANATIAQLAEKAFESVGLARELGFISVRISTEDAFRTTLDDYRRSTVRSTSNSSQMTCVWMALAFLILSAFRRSRNWATGLPFCSALASHFTF